MLADPLDPTEVFYAVQVMGSVGWEFVEPPKTSLEKAFYLYSAKCREQTRGVRLVRLDLRQLAP